MRGRNRHVLFRAFHAQAWGGHQATIPLSGRQRASHKHSVWPNLVASIIMDTVRPTLSLHTARWEASRRRAWGHNQEFALQAENVPLAKRNMHLARPWPVFDRVPLDASAATALLIAGWIRRAPALPLDCGIGNFNGSQFAMPQEG